ncbi:hypothetical protein RB595_008562 [Gaeumannomyces hyphopodioides]
MASLSTTQTDLPARHASSKRAAKACLACRSRKVRCDVSRVSQPCTNCQLHGKNCLVVGRASRLSTEGRRRDRHNRRPSTAALEADADAPRGDSTTAPREKYPFGLEIGRGALPDHLVEEHINGFSCGEIDEDASAATHNKTFTAGSDMSSERASDTHRGTNTDMWLSDRPDRNTRPKATVIYSHLRFLSAGNIHMIPPQDVNYLESQGCLHVPKRPMLDDFVEQYFLHVHPLTPLVDEGDFWDMYSQTSGKPASDASLSLLLFQAMLFSSCTFVPLQTIRKLGFSSLRVARGEFYRRVKLLYDMDIETTPLPLAQSALLLMAWVPPSNLPLGPYKTWLGRAIQHARSLGADRSQNTSGVTAPAASRDGKQQKALHRLWWCCVALDRVSPLCTRFAPHITRANFDFDASVRLCVSDFEDEIYRSSVYNSASKRRLAHLFEIYLDLMLILTDVLALVMPIDKALSQDTSVSMKSRIEACEAALERWFARGSAQLPPPTKATAASDKRQGLNRSIALHTSLMYIYFYHAKIMLHHHKLLILIVPASKGGTTEWAPRAAEFEKSRGEVQHAAASMTDLCGELTRRRLARWLPVSALACIFMPLALEAMSARLSVADSPPASGPSTSATSKQQARMTSLMEAMKAFLPQYDGVELIKDTVKLVADMAQTESQAHAQSPDVGRSATNWAEIMSKNPALYVKMTMTVDLTISKGRLAGDADLPAWLLGQMPLNSPGEEPHQGPGSAEQTRAGHILQRRMCTSSEGSSSPEDIRERLVAAGEAGPTVPQPEETGSAWWEGHLFSPGMLITEVLEGCDDPSMNYGPDGQVFEQPLAFEAMGHEGMAGIESIHDLFGWQAG